MVVERVTVIPTDRARKATIQTMTTGDCHDHPTGPRSKMGASVVDGVAAGEMTDG